MSGSCRRMMQLAGLDLAAQLPAREDRAAGDCYSGGDETEERPEARREFPDGKGGEWRNQDESTRIAR